jgi:hypothetical protein
MRRIVLVVSGLLLLTAAFASPGGASVRGATSNPSTATGAIPAFSHAFVIVGENTARGNMSPKDMPYAFGTLKPVSAWVNNYYSFHVDGSLANYIGMTSGQYTACEVRNNLPARCHQNVDNVFSQVRTHHRSWKLWAESATGPCDFFDSGTNWNDNTYGAHHNPSVYYDDITGGTYSESVAPKTACTRNVLPAGTTAPNDTSAMDTALASGKVGALTMIIPNDCENGHDRCGKAKRFHQFDRFLAREVPKIEASPAFDANSVIFITYDEGADPGIPNRFNVQMIATGPLAQPGAYAAGPRRSHYSLLRTLEAGLRLPYLRGAKTAPALGKIGK